MSLRLSFYRLSVFGQTAFGEIPWVWLLFGWDICMGNKHFCNRKQDFSQFFPDQKKKNLVIFLGFTHDVWLCYNLSTTYQKSSLKIPRLFRKRQLRLPKVKKKQLTIPGNYTIIGYIGEHPFVKGNSEIKGEKRWHRW